MDKPNHDFNWLTMMVDQNKDISLNPDMLSIDKVKKGYHIKFGLADDAGSKVIQSLGTGDGKYVAFVMVVNMDQFNELKKAHP